MKIDSINSPGLRAAALSCLAIIIMFMYCSPINTASKGGAGDDFPNAKASIGRLLAENLSVTGEWQDLSAIPDSITTELFEADTLFSTVTSDTGKSLAKSTSAGIIADTVIWNFKDTVKGRASYYYVKDEWFTVTVVTNTIAWNSLAKDTILGNETIISTQGVVSNKISESIIRYTIADSDLNGFLDTAAISCIEREFGRSRILSAFGSWGNKTTIADGTNIRVSCLELYYLSGMDTTVYYQLHDRNGDGHLILQGQSINPVTLIYAFKNRFELLPRKPIAGILRLEGGIVIGTPAKITADRFSAYYYYRDGRLDRVVITGSKSDSLLSGSDSLIVFFKRTNSDRSLALYDSLEARFVLVPGNTQMPYLLGSTVFNASINGSLIKEIRCSFVPDSPILPGGWTKLVSGSITTGIVYPTGDKGSLDGRIAGGIFNLLYTASDGTTQKITYSQDGSIIEASW